LSATIGRNPTLLAAAVLVAAIVIGAAIVASSYLVTSSRNTVTEAVTTTTTLTPSAELEPNGSLLLSKTYGPWSYSVLVNSTSVSVGGALLLLADLTYHGQGNTTIEEVEPINSVGAYNSTGRMVWEFTPSQITFEATVTPGETLGGYVCISVTTTPPAPSAQNHNCSFPFRQPVPGVYSLEAAPTFYSSSGSQNLGGNLQVTANFTVF
jgi:hypothetical protein